jgi:hypothetical protein
MADRNAQTGNKLISWPYAALMLTFDASSVNESNCKVLLSGGLECAHREDEEAQVIDRVTELDPNFVGGQWVLVRLRAHQGRIAEAVELAERLVHNAGRWGMTLGALGAAYAAAGKVDAAREVIAELGLDHNRQSRAFYSFLIAAALIQALQIGEG